MSKLKVKHRHRYTNEKQLLFNGDASIKRHGDYIEINYQEDALTTVKISADKDHFKIVRNNEELTSNLEFIKDQDTKNLMSSMYGDFDIEIHTYNYIYSDNHLEVEYDLISSGEPDGYQIIFEIKEESNEFN